jgi:DNA mismatch endonuclease (patch repair protein)
LTDVFSKRKRSQIMGRIRSQGSIAERHVANLIQKQHYKFEAHRRDLLGCPDFVFPRRKKVIFVHGCFWHQHKGCNRATCPKSNRAYWSKKLSGNTRRDLINRRLLLKAGWKVLTLWECQTIVSGIEITSKRINRFLDS